MKRFTVIISLVIAMMITSTFVAGISFADGGEPMNDPRVVEAARIFDELLESRQGGVYPDVPHPDYYGGEYVGDKDGKGEKLYIYFHDISDAELKLYKDALKDYEDAVVFGTSQYSYAFIYDYAKAAAEELKSKGYDCESWGPLAPDSIEICLFRQENDEDGGLKKAQEIVDAYGIEEHGTKIMCKLSISENAGRNTGTALSPSFPTVPVIVGACIVAAAIVVFAVKRRQAKA